MAAHRGGRTDGRTLSQRLEGSDGELEMTRKGRRRRREMGSIGEGRKEGVEKEENNSITNGGLREQTSLL